MNVTSPRQRECTIASFLHLSFQVFILSCEFIEFFFSSTIILLGTEKTCLLYEREGKSLESGRTCLKLSQAEGSVNASWSTGGFRGDAGFFPLKLGRGYAVAPGVMILHTFHTLYTFSLVLGRGINRIKHYLIGNISSIQ